MARLVIIPEDRLRKLIDRAVRQAVTDVLAESTSVDVPFPPSPEKTHRRAEPVELLEDHTAEHTREQDRTPVSSDASNRPYVIGRSEGEYTYADVVAIEYPKPVFRYDHAWEAIKDKIVTQSSRAKGSTRRSLDADDRFQRVHNDRDGIWFRRTDKE